MKGHRTLEAIWRVTKMIVIKAKVHGTNRKRSSDIRDSIFSDLRDMGHV